MDTTGLVVLRVGPFQHSTYFYFYCYYLLNALAICFFTQFERAFVRLSWWIVTGLFWVRQQFISDRLSWQGKFCSRIIFVLVEKDGIKDLVFLALIAYCRINFL